MKHSKFKKMGKKQSGFTLIELLMVVVILGILAYVSMSAFSGSPNAANATAIRSGATEIAKGIGYINANLGNGITTVTNQLINKGAAGGNTKPTMLDLLIIGSDVVDGVTTDPNLKSKYEAISMRPLETEFRVIKRGTSSVAGEYTLINYPVSVTDTKCPKGRVCIVFENVPDPVLDELLTRYGLEKVKAKVERDTTVLSPLVYTENKPGPGFNTINFALIP